MSRSTPQWFVLAWQELPGQWYCVELEAPLELRVAANWDRPDGVELADVMTPLPKASVEMRICGTVREHRRFDKHPAPFQPVIDTAQRMVRDHRP